MTDHSNRGEQGRGYSSPNRGGAPRGNKPRRTPQSGERTFSGRPQRSGPRPGDGRRNPPAPPAANVADSAQESHKNRRIDLPMAESAESAPEGAFDGMVYIAYGEHGDEYAFELSDELPEAVAIVQQMRDDGFTAKLFQAHEVDLIPD